MARKPNANHPTTTSLSNINNLIQSNIRKQTNQNISKHHPQQAKHIPSKQRKTTKETNNLQITSIVKTSFNQAQILIVGQYNHI